MAQNCVNAEAIYDADWMSVRLDNRLRYSNAFRIQPRNPELTAFSNGNDGDRNFSQGLISNKIDLLSALDVTQGEFGLHASAEGWYDTAYQRNTGDGGQSTNNSASVSSRQFSPKVVGLYGQHAELGDAFIHGVFQIADVPLSIRFGRQTTSWGESLFYDPNSIASAQSPTDYLKLNGAQDAYSNDAYLPVNQIVLTAQLLPNFSMTFYDQLEWRASREPGNGSYFSYNDFVGAGAARLFLKDGGIVLRRNYGRPSAAGQFGIALHVNLGGTDIGLYALRYDAKDPQIGVRISSNGYSAPDGVYGLIYPADITLYGASFSTTLGDVNIAGEVSGRRRDPLVSYNSPSAEFSNLPSGQYTDYERGDTIHAQVSATKTVGRGFLWDSATANLEAGADQVVNVSQGAAEYDPYALGLKIRALLEPHYFQVLPNLDLTLPIGIGYNLTGHSHSYYAQNAGAGDFEIGVSATFLSVWKANITLTSFIGSAEAQPLADRRFIAFSIERTF